MTRYSNKRCRLFIIGNLFFFNAVAQEVNDQKVSQQILMIRYLEDYSFLQDPKHKIDFYDPIKYLALSKKSNDRYLSIGGDIRFLYENVATNFHGEKTTNDYLLSRFMLHADWHQGKQFRLFSQLGSTHENGRTGGPRAVDEDRLFLHQFFTDVTISTGNNLVHTARVGRQEINLGSGRLITMREGPNTRLSFDGIRIISTLPGWQINTFYLRPVNNQQGVFDNEILEPGRSIWGTYTTKKNPVVSYDLFFIVYHNKNARYHQGEGKENRFTMGTRLFGKKNNYDFELETGYQFGTFDQDRGSGTISAFGGGINAGYSFTDLTFKPRIGVKLDYMRGDQDSTDIDLQTVNVLFPKQGYFRGAAALAPSNFTSVRPELIFNFDQKAYLLIDYAFFWRTSLNDGIYAPSGIPTNPLTEGSSGFLGGQLDFELNWEISRNFGLLVVYSKFYAGQALEENPHPTENDYFLNVRIGYKF